MKKNIALGIIVLLSVEVVTPEAARPGDPTQALLESAARAAELIDRAGEALGGSERLRDLESIDFSYEGTARFPYQGQSADQGAAFEYRQRVLAGIERAAGTSWTAFSGNETEFDSEVALSGADQWSRDELARLLRQAPHPAVAYFLHHPTDLQVAHETPGHYVLSGAYHADMLLLFLDRESHLLERIVRPIDDLRHGDAIAVTEFLDYRAQGPWKIPGRIRQVEAGQQVLDVPYTAYALNVPVDAPQGADPGEPGQSGDAAEAPAQQPRGPEASTEELAPGVFLATALGGQDYNSLIVDDGERVVVLETPLSIAAGRNLRERVASVTDNPIRYVSVSHHHGDHSGGLPAIAREGVTIIASAADRTFYTDMLRAQRSFLGSEHVPNAAPDFRLLDADRAGLEVGGVRVLEAGPSGHAQSHLVFYLAAHRMLFQGDMAVFLDGGAVEPARIQTCSLLRFIEGHDLDVEHIVGAHGRPGTMQDLRAAIEAREEPCPAVSGA